MSVISVLTLGFSAVSSDMSRMQSPVFVPCVMTSPTAALPDSFTTVVPSTPPFITPFEPSLPNTILFILPPLIFYMILQRKFIQSIDRVGIVG